MTIPDNPDWSIPAVIAETPAAVVAIINPPLGTEIAYVFGAAGLLLAVKANLITSATAGNRIPFFALADGAGDQVFSVCGAVAQPPSVGELYSVFPGAPLASPFASPNYVPMPGGIVVSAGWTLKTFTTALAATDQWLLGTVTTT